MSARELPFRVTLLVCTQNLTLSTKMCTKCRLRKFAQKEGSITTQTIQCTKRSARCKSFCQSSRQKCSLPCLSRNNRKSPHIQNIARLKTFWMKTRKFEVFPSKFDTSLSQRRWTSCLTKNDTPTKSGAHALLMDMDKTSCGEPTALSSAAAD